eukprot:64210-Pelagomonas_calceolata.AAC.1
MSDSKNLAEPNGAGITNTIGRAELAAIAASLAHEHTHMATDSLSSLHQLRKQILRKAQTSSGNEYTDRIAKYPANLKDNNLTDTGIPNAGPGSNPFYNIAWLDRAEARPSTPESSSSIPNL